MFVNGRTTLSRVTLDDVVDEATRWPLAVTTARAAAHETVDAILDHLDGLPDRLVDAVTQRAAAFRSS